MLKSGIYSTTASLLILISAVFLMGADAGDPGQGELDALRTQQSALRTRIEALKYEQDYLLFRRAMYQTDSKYLVMNIAARSGRLMYKNRVLKEFKFGLPKNFRSGSLQSGMVMLTKKMEDKQQRRTLVFGTSFLLHGKGTAVPRLSEDAASISVTKKDLASIYYALEEGAMAYLAR
jgi:hypothetical protein